MSTVPDGMAGTPAQGESGRGVILASESPRRKLLLPIVRRVVGTVSPDADETPFAGESSEALAVRLASTKLARARAMPEASAEPAVMLSADTVVSLDGQPLGKPSSAPEARAMLLSLRGRSHTVITAVALGEVSTPAISEPRITWVATEVEMRDIRRSEIEQYIARGEPFDKAGGYAIQDRDLRPIDSMDGCFPNVVGLPICAVQAMLAVEEIDAPYVPVSPPCELCKRAAATLDQHGFWSPAP